jgi:hypothetical protein
VNSWVRRKLLLLLSPLDDLVYDGAHVHKSCDVHALAVRKAGKELLIAPMRIGMLEIASTQCNKITEHNNAKA